MNNLKLRSKKRALESQSVVIEDDTLPIERELGSAQCSVLGVAGTTSQERLRRRKNDVIEQQKHSKSSEQQVQSSRGSLPSVVNMPGSIPGVSVGDVQGVPMYVTNVTNHNSYNVVTNNFYHNVGQGHG